MDIAIPRETVIEERRVALVPSGVDLLLRAGHRIYIESGAGEGAGFPDEAYEKVGAKIVYSHDEALRRGTLIVKVQPPSRAECDALTRGQVIASFLQLGVQTRERMEKLRGAGVTAFALELIEEDDGARPLIQAMGEITAGRIPVIAGRYMNALTGGRGIILGDVPGVPPATVVILGAGTVGGGAARKLGALGASVVLLDSDVRKLRHHLLTDIERPMTLISTPYNLERLLPTADIVVGAVSVTGERAPILITREMVKKMRPRSLIIDVSIDQGGVAETSHPTTHSNATYVEEGVIHYCVPNIPATVARSASYAFTNAGLPYLVKVAADKLADALGLPAIARAMYLRDGQCTHEKIGKLFGWPVGAA
ncbi:MAG TPA: alanine dehydrogenase [Polyangia bacterium]